MGSSSNPDSPLQPCRNTDKLTVETKQVTSPVPIIAPVGFRQDSFTQESLDTLPSFHVRQPSIGVQNPLHDDGYSTSNASFSFGAPVLKHTLSTASLLSQHSLSPGSAVPSPQLNAMTDLTPLPSPLMSDDSPNPWRRLPRPGSTGSLKSLVENASVQDFKIAPISTGSNRALSARRKKSYTLSSNPFESASSSARTHGRHRSISDYVPEQIPNLKQRLPTYSGKPEEIEPQLQREQYLAEHRGHNHALSKNGNTAPATIPTPPPSNRSVTESEGEETSKQEEQPSDALIVRQKHTGNKVLYRPVRPLGQGTFSKVVLATSQSLPASFVLTEDSEPSLDSKDLVAIKIVAHGPAGGADEERVELSLKREVGIMQSVSHPSIINLQAFDFYNDEALLVLGYCPGGDLFDLASQHRDAMKPATVQRLFAELVDAVRHLHSQWIVHRDIKLENVLVNVSYEKLVAIDNPQTFPTSLLTLTDLGLSRHIPHPPESPLLTTRCGSEDYAAPEILLSQPYDGRSTDGWALGVLLYALMEGRLPFDPPPPRPGARVSRARSRAAHRIARCDWIWSRFGDLDGEWDAEAGKGWDGGRDIVDGLLRKVTRGRWNLDEVASNDWVKDGIQVEGGLKR